MKINYWIEFLPSAVFGRIFILLCCINASYSQQIEKVDFINVKARVKPVFKEKKVKASASYIFKILKKCDSIYLDAPDIFLLNSIDLNSEIKVVSKNKKIWLFSDFKANKTYQISFNYEATPKKALYFFNNQIWTQGQGKDTSNWLPSINDMNDKIKFNICYIIPSEKTVIANGELKSITKNEKFSEWDYEMTRPISSYLVAFAVGDFSKKIKESATGTSIELYYPTNDSLYFEPTYRFSERIFNFLENEIDVKYPWVNYKQVPLHDFMYAGMENTTATFFSDTFIVDSIGFNDKNYVNVNAHELAHHWFGNLVTERSGADHWLHEGFASYYALLAEKDIFGEDYYYWKLYQSSEQLKYLSEEGKGEALNDPKASSITFYDKGGLALHILREIVGDEVFKEGVKNYLVKNQFQNVSIKDFLHEIEFIYGKSLSNFDRDWIKQTKFPYEEVYQSLMKSNFMRDYFNVLSLRPLSMSSKILDFDKILNSSNYFLSQEVVFQLQNEPISSTLPIYKKAFKTNDINIRQAIAVSMNKIPSELKTDYESLLDDKSYATQEIAFGNLCANFYLDRTKYLDKMDTVIGFRDKNIRQFWLFMALITEDYNPKKKDTYINELKKYSSSNYGYTVREKAFEYLGYLSLWDSGTLNNLIDACQHHYWRFRNFSRKLLMELWKNDIYKKQLILLSDTLDNQAHFFLNKILKEN
ncbi:MAG: M1 family metallopeptidase [Flavobacteriaceae bacterium]|nr:M1 family metallopeptidase [Flavobacteriaceae bacterium]